MAFSEPARESVLLLLVGSLAGAMCVAAAWVVTAAVGPDSPHVTSAPAALSDEAAADARQRTPPSRHHAGDVVAQRCAEVYRAQTVPLRTAAASLAQWEIHVGAMNQLVAGAITIGQARRFWEQTRRGAESRLDHYHDARVEYRARTARCVTPTSAEGPRVRACANAVAARRAALGAAATAIATWRAHVRHMEMLRRGEMSPEEATRMWLSSWHQGNREIKAYGRASRAAQGARC